MKKLFRFIVIILTLSALISTPLGCTTTPLQKYEETRNMWDTFIKVTVYAKDQTQGQEAIKAAFTRMDEIGNAASTFDEKAEAFRLNRDGYIDNPSADLKKLIDLSIEYNKLTAGYFDITVQPLLDVWSAGLWKESNEAQQAKVNEMLKLIGSDKIEVTNNRISFKLSGMKITLGGITKGYAVDEALKVLKSKGIKSAIIAAGGDVSSLGTKPGNELWQIALVNPDNTKESLATFKFAQKSVSTSGNYERYYSPDKKVNHLMNPKTGFSVADAISVTIIAENGTRADILATSVFVMGPDAGMKFVESLDDVECFLVDANRTIHRSSGVDKYLTEAQ